MNLTEDTLQAWELDAKECAAYEREVLDNEPVTDERILALIKAHRVMLEGLANAVETIHDEFCSKDQHHPICDLPRKVLEEVGGAIP